MKEIWVYKSNALAITEKGSTGFEVSGQKLLSYFDEFYTAQYKWCIRVVSENELFVILKL